MSKMEINIKGFYVSESDEVDLKGCQQVSRSSLSPRNNTKGSWKYTSHISDYDVYFTTSGGGQHISRRIRLQRTFAMVF